MEVDTWQIQGDGFHFGRQGLGQEITAISLPSDSLFAALVALLAQLRGPAGVETFMTPFLAGEPSFALSSTFPFAGPVRFFPAPIQPGKIEPGDPKAPGIKELKKVQYLSEGLFQQFLAGTPLAELYSSAVGFQQGQVLAGQEEVRLLPNAISKFQSPIWAIERRPRVTIGRRSSNSTIFFTGRVVFNDGCGLWFGLRWLDQDPEKQALVEMLLSELGMAGLGAERSIGFGTGLMSKGEPLTIASEVGKAWLSLSRYLPRQDEMDSLHNPVASYRLENVGGWLESPNRRGQKRRPANLLAAGSILGGLTREVPGQIVDVRPSYAGDPDPVGHAVYRSGLALAATMAGDKP